MTADSTEHNSYKKIVNFLNSSNKVDEVEWSSEPLPEDGSVCARISRRPSDIPQVDGERDKYTEESPDDFDLEETFEQKIIFNCEDCE